MYVITNRKLSGATTLRCFGKTPNVKGPKELRLVHVQRSEGGAGWKVKPVDDKLKPSTVKALKKTYHLDIDPAQDWYGSLQVACELFDQARRENKPILFFVHGYNNDVGDVLKTAHEIECLYKVIVVPFTWPANGGGAISGAASYLSDKSDARVSSAALNRAVDIIQRMHLLLTQSMQKKLQQATHNKHKNNPAAAAALYTRAVERDCNVKIGLLCHSMGNYVMKHTLVTSENSTSHLVFDNICLVAADTNNQDHADWVGKLDVRKRLYVVINERDGALMASRIKPGAEQKARLGHYIRKLNSPNAFYVDVSDARGVGASHSYFKGEPVAENEALKTLFHGMFNGEAVESQLEYHSDLNCYRLSRIFHQ